MITRGYKNIFPTGPHLAKYLVSFCRNCFSRCQFNSNKAHVGISIATSAGLGEMRTKTFSPRLTSFYVRENCEFKRFKDKFVSAIMAVRPSIRLLKLVNSHSFTQVKYVVTATSG